MNLIVSLRNILLIDRSGEYGYYEYDYVCSKCKHRKKGGVDKIYIGPGTGLPLPYNQKLQY